METRDEVTTDAFGLVTEFAGSLTHRLPARPDAVLTAVTDVTRGTWTWQARPASDGTDLTVTWRLHPLTLGRRSVIARLRRPMLQREVRASVQTLGAHIRS